MLEFDIYMLCTFITLALVINFSHQDLVRCSDPFPHGDADMEFIAKKWLRLPELP